MNPKRELKLEVSAKKASTKKISNMIADEVIAKFEKKSNNARLKNIKGLGFTDSSNCNRTMSTKLEAAQKASKTDYNLYRSVQKQDELIFENFCENYSNMLEQNSQKREAIFYIKITRYLFFNSARYKRKLLQIIFAAFLLVFVSCKNNDTTDEQIEKTNPFPNTEWKLLGFFDEEAQTLRKQEHDSIWAYRLIFIDCSTSAEICTLNIGTFYNVEWAEYRINFSMPNIEIVRLLGGTFAIELSPDGTLFANIIMRNNSLQSYSLNKDELKLFYIYNGKKGYLLFEKNFYFLT